MYEWEQIREASNALLFAMIAGIGGGVAYLSSIFGNRKKFMMVDFFIKIISSAFSGLLIGWVLDYYQYPLTLSCAIAGTAGYVGADFTVNLIRRMIEAKTAHLFNVPMISNEVTEEKRK